MGGSRGGSQCPGPGDPAHNIVRPGGHTLRLGTQTKRTLAVPVSCELPPVALHVLGDTARETRVLTAVGE